MEGRILLETRAKQRLFAQALGLPGAEACGERSIGNSHALPAIEFPVESDSKRLEHFGPAGVMHAFGIGQDPVEVEQQRVPAQSAGPASR
jgi:hypothetical protein